MMLVLFKDILNTFLFVDTLWNNKNFIGEILFYGQGSGKQKL